MENVFGRVNPLLLAGKQLSWGFSRCREANCMPTYVGCMHRTLHHQDFPTQAGPQLRGHVALSSVRSSCSPLSTREHASITQSTLPCIIWTSALSVLVSSLPWVVQHWLLWVADCAGGISFEEAMEEACGGTEGSKDFTAPWQELKPHTQCKHLLGSLPQDTTLRFPLPRSTCSSQPKLLLSNYSIKETVYVKHFGEDVSVLNLITWHYKDPFPHDSFIMEIFFTLGSLLLYFCMAFTIGAPQCLFLCSSNERLVSDKTCSWLWGEEQRNADCCIKLHCAQLHRPSHQSLHLPFFPPGLGICQVLLCSTAFCNLGPWGYELHPSWSCPVGTSLDGQNRARHAAVHWASSQHYQAVLPCLVPASYLLFIQGHASGQKVMAITGHMKMGSKEG